MTKRLILISGILFFSISNLKASTEEIDSLSSSYKIILDIPEDMEESGYDSLLSLCDSLGIEVSCFPDQPSYPIDIIEHRNKYKRQPLVEFKLCPGFGCTWGILNKEFNLGPTINLGWEITF